MEITLVPHGGLCNRMCAITSGALYAQYHPDVKVRILWNKTNDCSAKWSDLFEQPPGILIEELKGLKDIPAEKKNLYLPNLWKRLFYDKVINNGFQQRNEFEKNIKGMNRVYIYSYSHFNEYCLRESLAEFFRPTEELQKRIDSLSIGSCGEYLGVHVRRTDNVQAIKESSLDKYFIAIDAELKKDPECNFYIASDDESVKADLKSRYGDVIRYADLCLERNSVQGMKDAVVDLFCLGKTQKILGSVYSSYSMVASWLYNIELQIIK